MARESILFEPRSTERFNFDGQRAALVGKAPAEDQAQVRALAGKDLHEIARALVESITENRSRETNGYPYGRTRAQRRPMLTEFFKPVWGS